LYNNYLGEAIKGAALKNVGLLASFITSWKPKHNKLRLFTGQFLEIFRHVFCKWILR